MSATYDVFVSYRRTDGHPAGRLFDRLQKEFSTFYDIAMPRGRPFPPDTRAALRSVPVVVAVISGGWINEIDRLISPYDWLRRELEEALDRRDVLVIPVLIDDISIPDRQKLPESLRALCDLQAANLRRESWDRDVDELVRGIRSNTRGSGPGEPLSRYWRRGRQRAGSPFSGSSHCCWL